VCVAASDANANRNNTMTTEIAIISAAALGTKAFKSGKKCIPCHDSQLMALIDQNENKEMGASLPIMKAWMKSWLAANLAR
jgi:hypothetical protein